MRKRFIYDIETNGLLDKLDTLHCLVLYDLDTKELLSFGGPQSEIYDPAALADAVRMLSEADVRIGHNIIKFDEPAIAKLFPEFIPNVPGKVLDTLILTRLIWPNVADSDNFRIKRKQLDGRLKGSHSLEAWGQRIGEWKGDFAKIEAAKLIEQGMDKKEAASAVWQKWSQAMQDYCDQDVLTNLSLYRHCQRKGYAARAVWDEMDMAILCQKMEANGFVFNEKKAADLYATLAGERARLEDALKSEFGSWVVPSVVKQPKAPNKAQGYWGEGYYEYLPIGDDKDNTPVGPESLTGKGLPNAEAKRRGVRKVFNGYPFTPIKVVEFNPTSRFHIADRLKKLYGWKPEVFTPSGEPKVDEEVMAALPYSCGPLLTEYFTVVKRVAQLAEGRQAWMLLCENGRVHGKYNSVGAVTRRATHSNPNIGQVPSIGAAYGRDCRELFCVPEGWYQVGTDASGLELRCLAHYMSRWDNGAYGGVILNGDIHTVNQEAAGLPTRDDAKTFIYAFLYGAGDGKIGSIVGGDSTKGRLLRSTFMAKLPALGNLVKAVKTKAKAHKHLLALDGGMLHIRSDHSALNTLLQSAGSLICKRWLVLMERELLRRGYKHGWEGDFVFMAWVHDEVQVAAKTKELAHEIAEVAKWAIKEVEAYYQFKCPLDCESKIGLNWADCH